MQYETHQFRQRDFITPESVHHPLFLIGAGGIGSPTAMVLEKMGFDNLSVFDPDTVEEHNVGSQLYHPDQVDMLKVEALQDRFCLTATTYGVIFPPKEFVLPPFAIVVSGVDSMAAREEIWEYLKTQRMVSLYVDARMGLEQIRVYAVDPSDKTQRELYEKNLYPDSEADPLPCSAKAVAYNGFFAASVIGGIVSAKVRGAAVPFEVMGDMSIFGLTQTI